MPASSSSWSEPCIVSGMFRTCTTSTALARRNARPPMHKSPVQFREGKVNVQWHAQTRCSGFLAEQQGLGSEIEMKNPRSFFGSLRFGLANCVEAAFSGACRSKLEMKSSKVPGAQWHPVFLF